ncbi:MAG: hypothetical protein K6356_14285 [Chloroflexus sp.]
MSADSAPDIAAVAQHLVDAAAQLVIDCLPRLEFDNMVTARDTVRLDRVVAAALRV